MHTVTGDPKPGIAEKKWLETFFLTQPASQVTAELKHKYGLATMAEKAPHIFILGCIKVRWLSRIQGISNRVLLQ